MIAIHQNFKAITIISNTFFQLEEREGARDLTVCRQLGAASKAQGLLYNVHQKEEGDDIGIAFEALRLQKLKVDCSSEEKGVALEKKVKGFSGSA